MLKAEPGLRVLSELHDLCGMVAMVGPVGSAVVVVALGEDEDVVTATEGVLEDSGGPQIDIGVATRGLAGRGAIEVPNTQLTDVSDFFVNGLYEGIQTTCQRTQGSENLRKSWNGDRRQRRPKHLYGWINSGARDETRKRAKHTFGLDFITLGESEVWGQEVRAVVESH